MISEKILLFYLSEKESVVSTSWLNVLLTTNVLFINGLIRLDSQMGYLIKNLIYLNFRNIIIFEHKDVCSLVAIVVLLEEYRTS